MTTVFAVLLWILGQQPAASIEGTVVRAGTTQPLANLQVGLWPTSLAVKTDAEGKYVFRSVAPGRYALTAVHDGIKVRHPFTVNSAQPMNVTLHVPVPPAITGTVFDHNGERLAAARVKAFQTVYTQTGPRARAVQSTITDDQGNYRLFWMRPGEYTIGASYGEQERNAASAGLLLTSNLSKPDFSYPLTLTQKINLGAGTDSTNQDIFFRLSPMTTVSLRMLGPNGDVCARVALVPAGGVLDQQKDFGPAVCSPHTFRGISPGSYVLAAAAEGLASDLFPVLVPDRGAEIAVDLKQTKSIEGAVSVDGAPLRNRQDISVVIARTSLEIEQRFQAALNPDGTFAVKDIGPGAYDILVEPVPEGTHVASIRFAPLGAGGQRGALLGGVRDAMSGFRVESVDAGYLDVQLSARGGAAEGAVVDSSGQPVPGAQVVLMPLTNFTQRMDSFKVGAADAVGKFRIAGIPSGTYRAFAFEDIETGAYLAIKYNARAASQFGNRGTSVTIPGGGAELRLTAIPTSETSVGLR